MKISEALIEKSELLKAYESGDANSAGYSQSLLITHFSLPVFN